ncbi:MAG: hypothetical protein U0359_31120 [Byssovorax sp.]
MRNERVLLRRLAALGLLASGLVLGACGLVLGACGAGQAKAPNPTRPLDERRAIEVIRRAVANEGAQPAAGRDEKLLAGKPIHIDVGVEGQKFGIAYLTAEDLGELGDAIKPADKGEARLRVERADDEETRILILYQSNYLYDDLVGEGHEQTTITCEKSLTRDVQDFITYAKRKGYK